MKLKEGLVIRQLGSQYIVVATGMLTKTFDSALRFNEVGADIFNLLTKDTTKKKMIKKKKKKYNVSDEEIEENIEAFLNLLRGYNLLDE